VEFVHGFEDFFGEWFAIFAHHIALAKKDVELQKENLFISERVVYSLFRDCSPASWIRYKVHW